MAYEYKIPISGFPDHTAVAKEHEILGTILCPSCGEKSLQVEQQLALAPESGSDWPYPICGDKLGCRCENCGHRVDITFRFILSDK